MHRWADTRRSNLAISTDELGDVSICVHELGDGPPLLLVHGMGTTGYSWRYVLEPLASRFRLVIPDLPGAGESDCPDVYLGPDVQARAILAIIDGLGLRGVPVIGNSMGGYLCMRAALLDPAAMSRLVDLHSPGVPTPKMVALRWALRVLPGWRVLDRMIRKNPEKWVHENVHYCDESLKSREEHREYARALHRRDGRRAYYRQLHDTLDSHEMKRFVAALRAREFPIPLTLVYAPEDPIVPPIVGDRLHALIPQARFVKLAGGSHFAHVDAVPLFLEAIAPFLDEAAS